MGARVLSVNNIARAPRCLHHGGAAHSVLTARVAGVLRPRSPASVHAWEYRGVECVCQLKLHTAALGLCVDAAHHHGSCCCNKVGNNTRASAASNGTTCGTCLQNVNHPSNSLRRRQPVHQLPQLPAHACIRDQPCRCHLYHLVPSRHRHDARHNTLQLGQHRQRPVTQQRMRNGWHRAYRQAGRQTATTGTRITLLAPARHVRSSVLLLKPLSPAGVSSSQVCTGWSSS